MNDEQRSGPAKADRGVGSASVGAAGTTGAVGLDLSRLRERWQRRIDAAREVRLRMDPTGMTRPPRIPEERAWLAQRGESDVFVEVSEGAEEYRAYWRGKYGDPI